MSATMYGCEIVCPCSMGSARSLYAHGWKDSGTNRWRGVDRIARKTRGFRMPRCSICSLTMNSRSSASGCSHPARGRARARHAHDLPTPPLIARAEGHVYPRQSRGQNTGLHIPRKRVVRTMGVTDESLGLLEAAFHTAEFRHLRLQRVIAVGRLRGMRITRGTLARLDRGDVDVVRGREHQR